MHIMVAFTRKERALYLMSQAAASSHSPSALQPLFPSLCIKPFHFSLLSFFRPFFAFSLPSRLFPFSSEHFLCSPILKKLMFLEVDVTTAIYCAQKRCICVASPCCRWARAVAEGPFPHEAGAVRGVKVACVWLRGRGEGSVGGAGWLRPPGWW